MKETTPVWLKTPGINIQLGHFRNFPQWNQLIFLLRLLKKIIRLKNLHKSHIEGPVKLCKHFPK